jgi:hypothetical protein
MNYKISYYFNKILKKMKDFNIDSWKL